MHSGCTILDALVWHDGADTILIEKDSAYLNMLAKRFKPPPGDPQLWNKNYRKGMEEGISCSFYLTGLVT